MKEGDIVLTPILQADGRMKNHPALILRVMPVYQDFLVCGISTQLRQRIKDFDEVILKRDADFSNIGLVADSLIRLSFLAVLPGAKVVGSIGAISSDRHERLLRTHLTRLMIFSPIYRAFREAAVSHATLARGKSNHRRTQGVLTSLQNA